MPNLDFLTLYIVIFLNSLTVSVVWAGFAYTYRPHSAVQHWLAGTVLSLIGGIVLTTQGNEGALLPAIVGNTIIIFGFSQFWIGLRRFQNIDGGQPWAIGFTLFAALLMVAMHDNDRGRAIVYSAGQATVMLVCLVHLLRNRLPGIGAFIAMGAFTVAMLGQFMVIASNWAVLAGSLDYAIYYSLASYALLCTVFSGTVWNLGFAMMTIDKLHQKLTHLSETDELTGLANRRAFQNSLEDMHRQSANAGQSFSVILIDLNDFKPLNDRFGHGAGDQALVLFGNILRNCVRSTDLVARIGGDEFAIALPMTTDERARKIAEAIRRHTDEAPLELPCATVTLSASIGVASDAEARMAGADLVALADSRLYKDKHRHKASRSKSDLPRLKLITSAN